MRYRNPGKWIRELFPNQTKNIPTILVWSVIFILDIVLVFYLTSLMGITLPGMPVKKMSFFVLLYCVAAFAIFFAEAKLWDAICSKSKKIKE